MKLAAIAGLASFMITSLVVGMRLLALWRRSRELPELLLAVALLCTGFLSFAMGMVGKLLGDPGSPLRHWLPVVGLSIECTGCVALLLFAASVFHSGARWASGLAIVLAIIMFAGLGGEVLSGQFVRYGDMRPIDGPWIPLGLATRGVAPAWMAFESLRHFAMMRRRLALGLAEPLVVYRFALFGVAVGASSLGYAVSVVHRIAFGTGLVAHAWAFGTVSILASISALGIGLGFFPPPAYRRWVDRRHAS